MVCTPAHMVALKKYRYISLSNLRNPSMVLTLGSPRCEQHETSLATGLSMVTVPGLIPDHSGGVKAASHRLSIPVNIASSLETFCSLIGLKHQRECL